MKVNELRKMSIVNLEKEIGALLHEQFNMRMQGGTGQSVRSHLIRNVRKDLARVKTILTEKQTKGVDHE